MSKLRQLTALICGAIILLGLLKPVQSQSDFVIDNADGRRDVNMSADPGLTGSLANVAQRFTLVFVNSRRDIDVMPLPTAMQTTLGQVTNRVLLQYVNARRNVSISGPPAQMNTVLKSVIPRFVIQYANTRRDMVMEYPRELIRDKTPPNATNITAQIEGNAAVVRWTTNEFAVGSVIYGLQPGVYTDRKDEPYFERQHQLALPSVAAGTTLYFKVISTDLSGNQASTGEHSLAGRSELFLPKVQR